jgi:hypothetical protein
MLAITVTLGKMQESTASDLPIPISSLADSLVDKKMCDRKIRQQQFRTSHLFVAHLFVGKARRMQR